jgi:hypothetical protein
MKKKRQLRLSVKKVVKRKKESELKDKDREIDRC